MNEPNENGSFRAKVYLIVRQVPAGRVTTYGQVAEMIPPPPGQSPIKFIQMRAQWVGRAMRYAPDGTPWHRVINSQGRISLPAGSRPAAIQRKRLETEGVVFNRNGQVDLGRFGWEGPDQDWLKKHDLKPPRCFESQSSVQPYLFELG